MSSATFLLERLVRAGMHDVSSVEPVPGGFAALAGIATRRNSPSVFVKAFMDPPSDDVFIAEAAAQRAVWEQFAHARRMRKFLRGASPASPFDGSRSALWTCGDATALVSAVLAGLRRTSVISPGDWESHGPAPEHLRA